MMVNIKKLKGGNTMKDHIINLIEAYSKKHPLAKEVGGEYIYQNDSAQVDALELVAEIFNLLADNVKGKQNEF